MRKFYPANLKNHSFFIFALSIFFGLISSTNLFSQTQTFTATGTFTVPAGVNTMQVEVWGGGGAGGGVNGGGNLRAGGGGSGGTYTLNPLVTVTPGQTITVTVGAGGLGALQANGGNGGISTFASTIPVSAAGGGGGKLGTTGSLNGAGGGISLGITQNGGTGAAAVGGVGGGAGGGAGSTGPGGNGAVPNGGTGGIGGGGAGGNGAAASGNGTSSVALSGGGGGGRDNSNNNDRKGGDGFRGQIIVKWTCPTYSISGTSVTTPICAGGTSLVTLSSLTLPSGTYTVSYNLSAPNAGSGTAPMTFTAGAPGTGTFTTSALANIGTTTVTITNLSSGGGTGTGTLNCSNAIGANNTANTVVNGSTANAGPAVAAICQGGTSAALGGSFGGDATAAVWSDGGAGGTFTNNSGATPSTTTYTASATSGTPVTLTLTTSGGSCGAATASKQVVVNKNPTINVGGAVAAVCQGLQTANLGGSFGGGATGAVWSDGGAGGTFTNNTGATPNTARYTPSATAPPSVTLTLTSSGGSCGTVSDFKTLTVNPKPTVNVGGAVAAICQGGTTAALGGSFGGGAAAAVWSDGGAGGTFANNTGTTPNTAIYTASATSGTPVALTLTTSGGSCGTISASKQVVVNKNPTVSAGGAVVAICQGGTTAALGGSFGGGATSAVWSDGGAGGTFTNNTGTTPNTATYTASATSGTPVTLTLTTSGGSCGTISASKQITVNQNPTLNAGGAVAAICQGGTSAALGGSFGGGATAAVWSDGGAGGTFTNNTGATPNTATYKASATAPASVTLTLTTTGGACGIISDTKFITVNPNPTVNAGPAIADICQGGTTAALGGTFGGGATAAIWSDGGAGGTFANNGGATPNIATYTASATSGTPITLTLTTSGGSCGIISASKFLIVNPLPTATISGPASVCENDPSPDITFTGNDGTEPYTFTYNINGGPDQTVTTSGSASATVPVPTNVLGTFTYNLISVQDANCSQAQTGSVSITVNPLPDPTLTGPNPICQGSTGNVYVTESGQTNYVWTVVGGTVTGGGTPVDNTITISWTSPGAKSVTVNYTNSFGCSAATSATVVNDPVAVVPTITGPSPVCLNSTGNTYTTETGKVGYTWTVTGGTITAGGSSTDDFVTVTWTTLAGIKRVTLNYSDAIGCSAASPTIKNIIVNPLPTATISGTVSVCQGSPSPNITFTGAAGTAPYTFTYTINGGSNQTVTTISGSSVTVPVSTGTAGPFIYALVSVQDSKTCSQAQTGSATVTVNPLPTATIAGDITICQNDPSPNITFTGAGGTAPYTFTYKINAGANQTVTTISGNSVTVAVNTGTAGTFTYDLVDVRDFNTCLQAQSGTATVVIKPAPTVLASPASQPNICSNTPITAINITNPNGVAGTTFTWSRNNTINLTGIATSGTSATISGNLINNTTTLQTTTFTISAINPNGCSSSTTTAAVSVYAPLKASVVTASQSVCRLARPDTLRGTPASGGAPVYTYQWQSSPDVLPQTWTNVGGATTLKYQPPTIGLFTDNTYYRLLVTNTCGTAASDTVYIQAINDVGFTFTFNDNLPNNTVCPGTIFTPTISAVHFSNAAVRYSWSADPAYVTPATGGPVGTTGGVILFFFRTSSANIGPLTVQNPTNAPVTTTITITPGVYNFPYPPGPFLCNVSPVTFNVTINPKPVIAAMTSNACSGTAFTVSPQDGVPVSNVVPAGTTYSWMAPGVTGGMTGGSAGSGTSITGNLNNPTSTDQTATYTVTPTYTNGGTSCSGASFAVTVTVKPSATLTGALQAQPFCAGSAATINLTGMVPNSTNTVNYSIGGTAQPAAAVNADGSGNGSFTTRVLTIADNGVQLSITGINNGTCTKLITQNVTLIVNIAGTWLGLNTNWFDPTNWCGGIPTSASNITIPVTTSFLYPIIPAGPAAAVNNITIAAGGGSVMLSGGTMQVAGAITNNGVFDATTGTIEMIGSALQNIAPNTFQSNAVRNLIISNTSAAGVKLNGAMDLYGILSFTGNGKLLNAGNSLLVLRSTAAGTAMVADVSSNNAANNNNRITGNVIVERYYPNRRSWRLITAPVSGTKTIFNQWQVGGGTTNAGTAPAGRGTFVSKPFGTGLPTDGLEQSVEYSLDTFNVVTGVLDAVKNTNIPLSKNLTLPTTVPANISYFMFVRGDRTVSNLTPPNSNITTLRDTGTLQTYTKIFSRLLTPVNSFMLVGNPYVSAIDFGNLVRSANIPKKFWAWDPRLNTTLGAYAFVDGQFPPGYIIVPIADPILGSTGQNEIIQSSQAFFVQSSSPGIASVTFNENAKSLTDNNSVFRPQLTNETTTDSYENLRANLYLDETDTAILADGVYEQYNNSFSTGIDAFDGLKFINFLENFGIVSNGKTLVLERRPLVAAGDTIFFKLWKTTARKYEFRFSTNDLNHPGLEGYLEDSYLKTSTPVDLNGYTNVKFSINGDAASKATDRFRIVFKEAVGGPLPVTFTQVKAYQQSSAINVEWKVENEINIRQYEVERSTDGVSFTGIATVAATGNSSGSIGYLLPDENVTSGTFYYRIRSISNDGKAFYSNIVKVVIAARIPRIYVYPNPVIAGSDIGIHFINQPQGRYGIRLLNKLGQLIIIKQVKVSGVNNIHTLPFNKALAHGTYQLEISRPDGSKKNIALIY